MENRWKVAWETKTKFFTASSDAGYREALYVDERNARDAAASLETNQYVTNVKLINFLTGEVVWDSDNAARTRAALADAQAKAAGLYQREEVPQDVYILPAERDVEYGPYNGPEDADAATRGKHSLHSIYVRGRGSYGGAIGAGTARTKLRIVLNSKYGRYIPGQHRKEA